MKRLSAGLATAVLAALPGAAHATFGDADLTFGTKGLAPLRLETVSPAPSFARRPASVRAEASMAGAQEPPAPSRGRLLRTTRNPATAAITTRRMRNVIGAGR